MKNMLTLSRFFEFCFHLYATFCRSLPGFRSPLVRWEIMFQVMDDQSMLTADFGTGCFWCSEAAFSRIPGVISATPGYMGGHTQNPGYEEVCTGETGHAETIHIEYNPAVVTYETLLEWFFKLHDPTQLNRQGEDIGTQYRSVIFYHDEAQKLAAEKAITEESGRYTAPIVTQLVPVETFFPAEPYHMDYYRNNWQQNGYCRLVIKPKLEKLGLDN